VSAARGLGRPRADFSTALLAVPKYGSAARSSCARSRLEPARLCFDLLRSETARRVQSWQPETSRADFAQHWATFSVAQQAGFGFVSIFMDDSQCFDSCAMT
jgi:CelD/BcsL family acetyltransferase involved in cellulose biosynthesis